MINIAYVSKPEKLLFFFSNEWIQILTKHLESNNVHIVEQTVWLINNLISESIEFRNYFLMSKLFHQLITSMNILSEEANLQLIKLFNNLIFNCIKHKFENFDKTELTKIIHEMLFFLINFIFYDNNVILFDCLYSLYYISDIDGLEIDIPKCYIESGIIKRIFSINFQQNKHEIIPAVRILGNVLSDKNIEITLQILDLYILDFLYSALSSEKSKSIKKEILWVVTNMTIDCNDDIKIQLINSDLFPIIVNCLSDYEFSVRKEALIAITNICYEIKYGLSIQICQKKVLEELEKLIDETNNLDILQMTLTCIDHIFNAGVEFKKITDKNPLTYKFEQLGGAKKLEKLLTHPNINIYKDTTYILDTYFNYDNKSLQYF